MKEEKQQKGNLWVKPAVAFLALILVVNTWMIWQMRSVVERVDKYNQGVVDEIGGMTGDVKSFADDLNEIRRFLLLPEKNYSVIGKADQSAEDDVTPEDENNLAIYAMLESISKEKQAAENNRQAVAAMTALANNQDFLKGIQTANLQVGEKSDLQMKFVDTLIKNADGTDNILRGQPLFSLVFDGEDNVFKLQSALGEQGFQNYKDAGFASGILDYLSKNAQPARAKKLENLKQEELDKQKSADAQKQELQDKKNLLDNIVKDKAFLDTLAKDGWQTALPAREEANKYIYDVKDAQGKVVFSLAVELSSGMIKVLTNGQELDVKSFLNTDGSKKKS